MDAECNFEPKFQFKNPTKKQKDDILDGRNKKSTQRATESAVRQLEAFLQVQKLPKIEDIATNRLPDILNDFYLAIRPQKLMIIVIKLSNVKELP